jgi:RimJ/RimL family protein N-acetyltransferase
MADHIGVGPGETHATPSGVFYGTRVSLQPLRPDDTDLIYRLSCDPEIGSRWRFRGQTPDPRDFAAKLWNGTVAHYMVARRTDNQRVGYVAAHNVNLRDRWAYVSALSANPAEKSGLVIEGLALLIDHLFRNWPLHKVLIEAPEYNMDQYGRDLDKVFRREARISDYFFHEGKMWDLVVASVTASQWARTRAEHLEAVAAVDSVESDQMSVLSFDEFCTALSTEFEIDVDEIERGSVLSDDFEFDSLSFVLLGALVEELAGSTDQPPPTVLVTVADAYQWYCLVCSSPPQHVDR